MLSSTRAYFFAASALIGFVTGSTNQSFETVHTSNAAVFNRLGLSPLEISNGHLKKRLAEPTALFPNSQSRIHQPHNRRDDNQDSHVYFVKLPASQPYYTVTKSHKATKNDKFTVNDDGDDGIRDKTGPVFHNNGKTAKIYHWNLPLMKTATERKRKIFLEQMKKKMEYKKMTSGKQHFIQPTSESSIKSLENENTISKILFNSKNIRGSHNKVLLSKHARNNDKRLNYPVDPMHNNEIVFDTDKWLTNTTQQETLRPDDRTRKNITSSMNENLFNHLYVIKNIASQKLGKNHKKAAISYYAPNLSKTGSTSIHKNFPGNGKLKAFYVMERSRKPIYYHPLLP